MPADFLIAHNPRKAPRCHTCGASRSGPRASCWKRATRGRAPARSTATAPPAGRQTRTSSRQCRCAAGLAKLPIIIDSHERYAWTFSHQRATTSVRPLPAGDYGVEWEGRLVASVERKSLPDLVATSSRMRYLLAALAELPRAAVVVEDRYSGAFRLDRVRPAVVADGLAECAARYPTVPVLFRERRSLAQEWTYRFLAASLRESVEEAGGDVRVAELSPARPPTVGRVRPTERVTRPRRTSVTPPLTATIRLELLTWGLDEAGNTTPGSTY